MITRINKTGLRLTQNEAITETFGQNAHFVKTPDMKSRGFYVVSKDGLAVKDANTMYELIFITRFYDEILKHISIKLGTIASYRFGIVNDELELAISYFTPDARGDKKSFTNVDRIIELGYIKNKLSDFIETIDNKFNKTALYQIAKVSGIVELFFHTHNKEELNTISKVKESIEHFINMDNHLESSQIDDIINFSKKYCMSEEEAEPHKKTLMYKFNSLFRKRA